MADVPEKILEALYQVSTCFAQPAGHHETLTRILSILHEVAGYRQGTVTLVDPVSGDLLVEASHGLSDERIKDVRYRRGEGITGLILETGTPLAIPRMMNDPRFLHRLGASDGDAAFLGVPIVLNGNASGVFTVMIDSRERYRLDQHLKAVAIFANLIGSVTGRLLKAEQEKEDIEIEKERLHGELQKKFKPDNMVGVSKVMQEVFYSIGQVARWNTTVLIRGESGTGKELVAKAIHYSSPRSGGPFVKLNCAALPETLIESELFGYEKGAFTGAGGRKPGRFELAHKGTLFLDEIGETSPGFQAKLLRVLQEGQFERLGGTETISVNVRLIAATNADLEKAVASGNFREDLYYRLNVMPIFLPSLKDRKEDIPYLAEYFLDRMSEEYGQTFTIEQSAMAALHNCDWPGNVREFENCLQRAAVTSRNGVIDGNSMPCTVGKCPNRFMQRSQIEPTSTVAGVPKPQVELSSIANDRERVLEALKRCGYVQAKAARMLNMTPRQIAYRIEKYNIPLTQL